MDRKRVQSLDDFFVELSRRRERGVYFYRMNCISDDIRGFIYRYYDAARRTGVIVEGKIANPTEENLSYYSEMMGLEFRFDEEFILSALKKWLPRMNLEQRGLVAHAIYETLK